MSTKIGQLLPVRFIKALFGANTPSVSNVFATMADINNRSVTVQFACSDEVTAITATTGKISFRMPHAMTLTEVRASLATAQTGGNIFTVDINEGGTTVLSTK